MSVLSEARDDFREQMKQAYRKADRELNQRLVGEEVRLTYPYREGENENARVPEVTGTVRSVVVGSLPGQDVEFTTSVNFEDGREFTDAEKIEVI